MFEPLLPLTTDADLVAMADELVGSAIRRQTWVFLLDEEQRMLPVVVPMDGVPADADPVDVATMADRVDLLVGGVPEAMDGAGAMFDEARPEELAALIGVLSAAGGGPVDTTPPSRDLWGHPVDKLRYQVHSWQRVTLLERTHMRH